MIKNFVDIDTKLDKFNDECGVFGIYRNDDNLDSVAITHDALFGLQHRGQESAGITVNFEGEFSTVKELGMVSEVFTSKTLSKLKNGKIAIGHVRYTSNESLDRASNQPLVLRYKEGSIGIASNGSITNFPEIRIELERGGAIFQSNSNAELMAYVIASERCYTDNLEDAVLRSMDRLKGAYSTVICAPTRLIGFRDMYGFRPLCVGKIKNSYVISSESCVFDSIGAEFIRDIEPGEIVVFDKNGVRSIKDHCGKVKRSLCVFEYIYFARPDSVVDGCSVHKARCRAGAFLALEHPVNADVVVGVPDSGLDAAVGYSKESGIPYGIGFIKNKYIGRTFIAPGQKSREDLVRIKLNPVAETVKGKRVVLIDDSIVRGTTCARIIKLLREAGAKEVHFRVSSAPVKFPCYLGIDTPTKEELISSGHDVEEIRKEIGADSLAFISVDGMFEALRACNPEQYGFCKGCFTGEYPMRVPGELIEKKVN